MPSLHKGVRGVATSVININGKIAVRYHDTDVVTIHPDDALAVQKSRLSTVVEALREARRKLEHLLVPTTEDRLLPQANSQDVDWFAWFDRKVQAILHDFPPEPKP